MIEASPSCSVGTGLGPDETACVDDGAMGVVVGGGPGGGVGGGGGCIGFSLFFHRSTFEDFQDF